jgi:hypothetical protein
LTALAEDRIRQMLAPRGALLRFQRLSGAGSLTYAQNQQGHAAMRLSENFASECAVIFIIT